MSSDEETETQTQNGGAATAKGQKAARPKTTHPLPTERIARTKQLETVRAYGQLGASGGPVNASEVATMVGLTASTLSLANGFLTDVGLLVRTPEGLAPSADVINYARAYEWNVETAGEKLAPTLEASWIGAALLRKVRFRMHSKQEALALLADASGASASHKSQLEDILEILAFASLVVLDGEAVKPGKMMAQSNGAVAPVQQEAAPVVHTPKAAEQPAAPATPQAQPQAPGVSFNISLSVSMAELALLPADKITAFFSGVATVVGVQAQIDAIRKGGPG